MKAQNIKSYQEYLRYINHDASKIELKHLINAISTNVTEFFREIDHFEFTKKVYSRWLSNGQRRFRFWSAGCSSGEEPYSLAMILHNLNNGFNVDLKILATDISTRVLERGKKGIYSEVEIDKIPDNLKRNYFMKDRFNDSSYFVIDKKLKESILFKVLNLSKPPFPMHGPFDIIFCRNVMIYFDDHVRSMLLNDIHRLLKQDGYLIVGHAESLTNMSNDFKYIQPAIYKKK